MIKLNHLDKFYNKGKSNELHVLNDIDISLPDTGFITFFGPSGSGKTTLLNVIGGLDKAKGTIDYDDVSLTNYPMKKTDDFRRESIGYIFQNYQLLTELTVYENLRMALEAISITDKEECDKRINYCLRRVGLYSFRKKPAGSLSGGQMQRVSIARALVKNCKIIIADEPTGNLDSENSLEIMKILKRISKTSLVLLVTHNPSLAEFYSDTIMEVHDGKITAIREGNKNNGLDESHLNKIYLGDLHKEEISGASASVETYSETEKKLTLQVIEHNGQYFLRSAEKIKLLDDSPFTLVEGRKEEISADSALENEFDYDTSFYNDGNRHHSTTFFRDLKKSFFTFFSKGKKGSRFLKVAFVLLGVIMAFVDMTAIRAFYVSGDIVYSDNTYVLNKEHTDDYCYNSDELEFLKTAVENNYIDGFTDDFSSSVYLVMQATTYEQVRISADGYYFDTSLLNKDKILDGRMPEKADEMVVSRSVVEAFCKSAGIDYTYDTLYGFEFSSSGYNFSSETYRLVGIYDSDDYAIYSGMRLHQDINVGGSINYNGLTAGYAPIENYEIVYGEDVSSSGDYLINETVLKEYLGISGSVDYTSAEILQELNEYQSTLTFRNYETKNNDSLIFRGVYRSSSSFAKHLVNDWTYVDTSSKYGFEIFSASSLIKYRIVEGRDIENHFEMLVSPYSNYDIGEKVGDCTVVGTYFYEDAVSVNAVSLDYFSSRALTDNLTFNYLFQHETYGDRMYLHTSDASALAKAAKDAGMNITDVKTFLTQQKKKSNQDSRTVYATVFAILMAMVAIYIYFTMRSKMIKDIYTIGVERSLGFSRGRIILRHLADILVTTAFTSFLGYLITVGVIEALEIALAKSLAFTGVYILVPWLTYFLGVMLILMSLLFGLLPILLLLRKTPAEITSKYDI